MVGCFVLFWYEVRGASVASRLDMQMQPEQNVQVGGSGGETERSWWEVLCCFGMKCGVQALSVRHLCYTRR